MTKRKDCRPTLPQEVPHEHAALYKKGEEPAEYWLDMGERAGIAWANHASRLDLMAWHRTAAWAARRGFRRDNFPLPEGTWDHAEDIPGDDARPGARTAFAQGFFDGVRHIFHFSRRPGE